jgi:hypothetical protein
MGLTPNHSAYQARRRWERRRLDGPIRVVTDTSVIGGRGVSVEEFEDRLQIAELGGVFRGHGGRQMGQLL